MIGSRIEHYQITNHLGSGGMGEVYQATDSKLGRSVAIKLLPEAFARDTERVVRLEREARLLASLNHPNIAVIFGLEESDGRKFLVMEFVDGETLAERIKRGAIPVDEALGIAKQIVEALEGAHEKGVIHRDLKPANIKITTDGKVKVLDFGLAKAMDTESSNPNASNSPTLSLAATNAGLILGTASYMSPEQAKGRPVDRRTDIFAFGCVLYEMVTGHRAFDGEDVTEILGAVVRLEPDWTRLPANVPSAVRKLLRLCLEKNARNRRGTATDVRLDIEEALKESQTETTLAPAPARNARLAWIVASVFLIIIILLSFPYFRSKSAAAVMRFQVAPPAGGAFAGGAPGILMEIAPDGKHLAFFAASEGKPSQLWIRSLDSVDARPFPGTEGGTGPFWSPDSRFVGFAANRQLKKIDITGGPAQTLCSTPGAAGGNGTWNREGVIVFGSVSTLYRVSAEGGTQTPVTALDTSRVEIMHLTPQFLPDGRHLLYVVRANKPEVSGIYVASLDSRETARLLYSSSKAQFAPSGQLLFVRDGALFAQPFDPGKLRLQGEPMRIAEGVPVNEVSARAGFSIAENGVLVLGYGQTAVTGFDLSWYDRAGKQLTHIGAANYRGVELSPDGKRLAAHRHDDSSGGGDVWITDLERGTDTRFTFDASQDSSSPVWSPDGTAIAFGAIRNGQWGLYRKPSNGVGTEELLFESNTPKVPMTWSPDGKSLVFANYDPKTQADLWVLPLSGDRKPTPYLQSLLQETHAQISPDGHWIAYFSGASSGPSGGGEIYVQSYPTSGTKWQVSTNTGRQPRWRADGKELFFVDGSSGQIWAAAVESNGSGLTFGAPKPLFDSRLPSLPHLPSNTNYFSYAVSPDGQKFLIPHIQSTSNSTDQSPPLTVILNWTTLLTK